jgi:hypothetical protein
MGPGAPARGADAGPAADAIERAYAQVDVTVLRHRRDPITDLCEQVVTTAPAYCKAAANAAGSRSIHMWPPGRSTSR